MVYATYSHGMARVSADASKRESHNVNGNVTRTHSQAKWERERALTHRAGAYHIDGATVSSTMNNVKNAVHKRLAQAHTIRLSLNRNNTCISRMISAEYDVLYAFVPNQMDESCSIVCTNQVVQFFFLSFHPAAKIRKSENVTAARYEQNCWIFRNDCFSHLSFTVFNRFFLLLFRFVSVWYFSITKSDDVRAFVH